MKSNKRGVIHVHLGLAVLYLLGKLSSTTAQDDCVPEAGRSGNLKSVVLIIQRWEAKSTNFHVSISQSVNQCVKWRLLVKLTLAVF